MVCSNEDEIWGSQGFFSLQKPLTWGKGEHEFEVEGVELREQKDEDDAEADLGQVDVLRSLAESSVWCRLRVLTRNRIHTFI